MNKTNGIWILDDDQFFGERIDINGRFEYDKLKLALKYVTNWDCAVDGGAHYGTWSIPMAEKFKEVISFEARGDIHQCLIKNLEQYPNAEVLNNAIGDRFDNVEIGIGKHKGKLGNSGIQTIIGPGNVPMIPIDSLELQSLGFLKLDIEGYELFALKGAKETLSRCKPVVIFEENFRCNEHGVDIGESGKFLESLGATLIESLRADHIYGWK